MLDSPSNMKIITWNCNMAYRKKAVFILTHKPDILIVPECECPGKLLFTEGTPKPTDILWFGENKNKGREEVSIKWSTGIVARYSKSFAVAGESQASGF